MGDESDVEPIVKRRMNPPVYPSDNSRGMMLRDYFAIHAPVTMADAEKTLADENAGFVSYARIYKQLSQMQFSYADEMLKTRNKE